MTIKTTHVAKQQISNKHQWIGRKALFPERSAPMVANATMDTATEERGFLGGPCLHVTIRTISECSSVCTGGFQYLQS
jgi:hypothetical protein